jgi:hypothetical protein
MIRDTTGRFPERPHYEPAELEVECEQLVSEFLGQKNGREEYPMSTDDLTVLLEQHTESLDLYADLSADGADVEGVTTFAPGLRPRVSISSVLSSGANQNRLRTTLTHELGHVHFHGFLFELRTSGLDLFGSTTGGRHPAAPPSAPQKCHRQNIVNARQVDWMEWQAGYACGAILMPASRLAAVVRDHCRTWKTLSEVPALSPEGASLIDAVVTGFGVSRDAARVRLLKRSYLVDVAATRSMFPEE